MESAKTEVVVVVDIILSIISTTFFLVLFVLFTNFAGNFKHQ